MHSLNLYRWWKSTLEKYNPNVDQVCYQVTDNPDFSVAMATDLLENWPAKLANETSTGFQPYISYLTPSQVVLGYLAPNAGGTGDGSPIVPYSFY